MPEQPRGRFPRRAFLAGGGAAILAAVMAGGSPETLIRWLSGDETVDPGRDGLGASGHETLLPVEHLRASDFGSGADFTFAAERAQDLVLLDFAFYGFALGTILTTIGSYADLHPTTASNVIVVRFPPQAIGEASYNVQQSGAWWADPPPVLSTVSAPSQLCFQMSMGDDIVLRTMSVSELLDWSSWTLLVPEPAQVVGPPAIIGPAASPTPPTSQQTSIEYPTNMFLSPTVYVAGDASNGFSTTFETVQSPLVSSSGFADLWTATLQQAPVSQPAGPGEVVAFYANDFSDTFQDDTAINEITY